MKIIASFFLLIAASQLQAQSLEDFLDCASYSDRVERVFCLENTLEAAIAAEAAGTEAEPSLQPEAPAETTRAASTDTEAPETPARTEERSGFRLPVIGNIFRRDNDAQDRENEPREAETEVETSGDRVEEFGRPARVVVNEDGADELIDVVTSLITLRPNMWQITLASGQVWRQTHVRRYNLREGEQVRIYPTTWGDNYRLETERLSGFIQVSRVE